MRDILVTLVVCIGVLLAFKRPYYGVLLWVWIGLMNPHRLGWGFAYEIPFALIAVLATVTGMALHPNQVRRPVSGVMAVLLLLVAWMGVSTLFSILIDPSMERYIELLKVIFMTVITVMLVRSRDEIIGLVWVVVGSIGFFGVKGGIFTIATAGAHRVWGPPSSQIEGNNEIAVALIVIIPLLYFLTREARPALHALKITFNGEKWVRLGLYAAMGLCAIAAIGSQSRGALLASGAMLTALWWKSNRKTPLALFFLLAVPAVLVFMPDTWHSRMETIGTYEQDSSAMGRINAWTMAFNIAKDRITGAGFATASPLIYQQYAPDPSFVLVAHSIYFQILGEHGFIGLALYLLMWIMTYRMAGRIVRLAIGNAELAWATSLAAMTKVSMIGFAVGGAFLSLAYWDLPFYLIAILIVLERFVRNFKQETTIDHPMKSFG